MVGGGSRGLISTNSLYVSLKYATVQPEVLHSNLSLSGVTLMRGLPHLQFTDIVFLTHLLMFELPVQPLYLVESQPVC